MCAGRTCGLQYDISFPTSDKKKSSVAQNEREKNRNSTRDNDEELLAVPRVTYDRSLAPCSGDSTRRAVSHELPTPADLMPIGTRPIVMTQEGPLYRPASVCHHIRPPFIRDVEVGRPTGAYVY